MKCDFSIVIPNFNHGPFFPSVVENCFSNNPLNTEVIVVDDGSTDDSLQRLRELSGHFQNLKVVSLGENRGVPHALNVGAEIARGRWMVFRAADDLFPDNAIQDFAAALQQFPDCGLIAGDVAFFHDSLELATTEKTGIASTTQAVDCSNYLIRYGGNIIHGTSTFVRKQWVMDYGGFDDALKWHSDWYLLMKLGMERGFVYVPTALGAMRLNPQSYNSAGTLDTIQQNEVLKALIQRLDMNPAFKDALLQNRCLDFFGEPLKAAIEQHAVDPGTYIECFQKSSCDMERVRSQTGLKQVFRQFLEEHAEQIESHRGPLVLFGSGGHSQQLMSVMLDLGMRSVDGVVDNFESAEDRFFQGIKIESPLTLKEKDTPLVILSSKSYEPLFRSTMEAVAPGIPFLKIWGRS